MLIDFVWRWMGHGSIRVAKHPDASDRDPLALFHDIDALIISHEHMDHFELEVLCSIHEAFPSLEVWIPNLSSESLESALIYIGFTVNRYGGFDTLEVGDLSITTLPCVHSKLEPDIYALLITDRLANSSFLTSIDSVLTSTAISYLKAHCPRRTLDNFTNNYVVRSEAQHGIPWKPKGAHLHHLVGLVEDARGLIGGSTLAISGLGWTYPDPYRSLNALMFPAKHEELAAAIVDRGYEKVHPCRFWDQFALAGSNCVVRPAKANDLPDERSYMADGRDAAEILRLTPPSKFGVELEEWIAGDLSRHVSLGAHDLRSAFHAVRSEGVDDVFALCVHVASGIVVFTFDFAAGRFRAVDGGLSLEELRGRYSFGVAVPASVLDAIRLGKDEAHINFEVAAVTWNKRWDLLPECADVDLAACLHPRFRPDYYLDNYRQKINEIRSRRA